MIRLFEVRLPIGYTPAQLKSACSKRLHLSADQFDTVLFRRGIDARKGHDPLWSCTVDILLKNKKESSVMRTVKNGAVIQPYRYEYPSGYAGKSRPVIVGAGPAGLFCALSLAKAGARPILIERGGDVDSRAKAVHCFWAGGAFSSQDNAQFGEGGAGTFSDGKLTSGINDSRSRQILLEFVKFGAPEEILVDALPHVGTDRLRNLLKNMRSEILSLGGEIRFYTQLTDILMDHGTVQGAVLSNGEILPTEFLIMAIGHSARDTFRMLRKKDVAMAPKPFAMGVRIEHRQQWVSETQYGSYASQLAPAPYKLACHLPDGRGVYTFCMCPGGVVIAAASEKETIVTNGMSYYDRSAENANSALLVSVSAEDFPQNDLFAGMNYQEALERKAYELTGRSYLAPAQRVEDFLSGRESSFWGDVHPSYQPGTAFSDLNRLFPAFLSDSLKEGLSQLDRKLHGFSAPDAVLTGPETRSSSPVRILRNPQFQSISHSGLFPCGEGAGYAGGIVSAAVDGLRVAEAVCLHSKGGTI